MQSLTFNRNKQVVVTNFSEDNQKWLCPYCLTQVKDSFCKKGYIVTCIRCKNEFEIFDVRKPDGSLKIGG